MRKFIFTLIVLLLSIGIATVNAQDRTDQQANENKEKLLRLADRFHQEFLVKRAEVERVAQEKGWDIRVDTEEALWEIQYIDEFGMPQSYITSNLNAARTVNTDDLWTGGSSGLNLDGTNYLIGEWDGGGVLTTHQEFDGRVTQMDSPGSTHYHSTHVAGTLIAEGQIGAAKGMAHEGLLNAYDWTDDDTEMATAASNNLTLSNHSYGWNRGWVYNSSNGYYYWYGNTSISTTEDYLFGFYDASSQDWDQIVYDAPHYLIVKAAMNDRSDDWNSGHYVWGGTSWVWSTASRDPDGYPDGYDCIDQHGVPKNILTVGAVNDITGGWTSPSDVVMTSFSSWGPTDDGRIKPDIVGNGWNLYSCSNSGNSSYLTLPGTSMAAPNVAGTLALLQDYYQSLRYPYENGYGTMSAAAIKGLAINTANEAGPNNGPDYMFGWGLLNATGAADLITADDLEGGLIVEGVILDGQNIDYTYYCDGTSDIRVTLCWTDPPGTPPAASLNPTTGMLVHDLDVYVINASSIYYYPWRLNPTSPSSPATNTSFNYRDNVERTDIYSPAAGYYTIRIEEFSVLPAEGQAYSLIIQGLETEPSLQSYCDAYAQYYYNYEQIKNVTIGGIDNTTGRSPGGYGNYSGLIGDINKGSSQSISMEIQGFSGDLATAWVDWNQDGDFSDSGEAFSLGSGAGPVYTSTITAPSTALGGYTTMRVRLTYSTPPTACGYSAYGETEDYTLQVHGTPGLWTGTVSTNWNNPLNWDDVVVPTSTVSVTIPSGTPYQPTIGTGTTTEYAYCDNLTIQSGAVLTQTGTTTFRSFFHVNGNFDSDAGTFTQNSDFAFLYFEGSDLNSSWDDDNEDDTYTMVRVVKTGTNNLNMWQDMTVKNLEIREGNFQIDASWTLTVTSNLSYAFQVEDGGILTLAAGKTINVTTGDVEFANGSQANVSGGLIRCGDEFRVLANTAYDIQFTGGTVEMYGSLSQYIEDYDGNTELYDLIINKSSGTCYLNYGDLVVNNNLTITAGSFTLNGHELTVLNDCDVFGTLNMTNAADVLNIGDAAYDNLAFGNGSYGNLSAGVVNLASWAWVDVGGLLTATTGNTMNFNGPGATGIEVDAPGSVFGNINVISASALYLYSNSIQLIEIDGNFDIQAGNTMDFQNNSMVVHGLFTDDPTSIVYVYQGPVDKGNTNILSANGKMEDQNDSNVQEKSKTPIESGSKGGSFEIDNDFTLNGLMDVGDGDVLLHGTFSIATTGTLNIDGGSFIVDAPAKSKAWQYLYGTFNMTDGLFEITNNSPYFGSSATTNISGGIIRSGVGFNSSSTPGVFTPTGGVLEMIGNVNNGNMTCHPGNSLYNFRINCSTGNAVHYTSSSTTILNDLTIDAGSLECGYGASYDLFVGGNWTNNVGTGGFIPNTGTVSFNGSQPKDITTPETFYDLSLNKTFALNYGLEIDDPIVVANDFHIIDGCMEFNLGAELEIGNDLIIEDNAGLNVNDAGFNIYVGGNWINGNTDYSLDWGFSPGASSTVYFNGSANQYLTTNATQEDFNNLSINKPAGYFISNDNIQTYGNMLIYSGIWEDGVSGLTHTTWDDFAVGSGGAMYTSSMQNTIVFKGASDATLEYLGASGYFHNITVDKTSTKYEAALDPDAEKVSPSNNTDGGKAQSVTVLTYFTCQMDGSLIIDEGTLNMNGNNFGGTGNVTINDGGTLIVDENATLKIGDGNSLNINSGGFLYAIGSSGNEAKIQTLNTGYYNFNINSGGTIGAEYTIFEDMTVNGVYLQPGSLVDPTLTFNYCTFQNGTVGYATLMNLASDQTYTCVGVNFPSSGGTQFNTYKYLGSTGQVTFLDYVGAFAGELYENDPGNNIFWEHTEITLDLTVMLEGPFNAGTYKMDTDINGIIPNNHPFNPTLPYFTNPEPDWYYTGGENTPTPNVFVIDWVLVELRDATSVAAAGPGTMIAQQAAFVLNTGEVVDLDGLNMLYFTATINDGLYVVVWHRNHLGVISASALVESGGVYIYDFSSGSGQAYGGASAQKNLGGTGVWGLMSGDGNGSGQVLGADKNAPWAIQAGTAGYLEGDYNLNGQVNNSDKNDKWVPNYGAGSFIPE